ncbi:MAG TPA: Rieske (2Fe-2S) protein [Anaerolineales bacterium]|nr:Rieske (2Fe-2S) protein [Anaerolineales bacterium]
MKSKPDQKQSPFAFTRRMFLQIGLWFSAAISSWGILKFLSFDPPREVLLPSITLDEPITYLATPALYVPEVKAWLMHDDKGLYAVTSTCTHLGCTVNHDDTKFVCPCHGSQFNNSGEVLQGPAVDSLEHYEVSLSPNGRVVINRLVTVSAIDRLGVDG